MFLHHSRNQQHARVLKLRLLLKFEHFYLANSFLLLTCITCGYSLIVRSYSGSCNFDHSSSFCCNPNHEEGGLDATFMFGILNTLFGIFVSIRSSWWAQFSACMLTTLYILVS